MIKLKPILEATIKDLLDLNIRENEIIPKKIKYLGFSFRNKIIYFQTGDYIQKVQIPGLKVISRLKGNVKEKIEISLRNDDIKLFCSCHDWNFSGMKYLAHILGYGTNKETRKPIVRNPDEDLNKTGPICKHLDYLLKNIYKYTDEIVSDYNATRKTRKTKIHGGKGMLNKIRKANVRFN